MTESGKTGNKKGKLNVQFSRGNRRSPGDRENMSFKLFCQERIQDGLNSHLEAPENAAAPATFGG